MADSGFDYVKASKGSYSEYGGELIYSQASPHREVDSNRAKAATMPSKLQDHPARDTPNRIERDRRIGDEHAALRSTVLSLLSYLWLRRCAVRCEDSASTVSLSMADRWPSRT